MNKNEITTDDVFKTFYQVKEIYIGLIKRYFKNTSADYEDIFQEIIIDNVETITQKANQNQEVIGNLRQMILGFAKLNIMTARSKWHRKNPYMCSLIEEIEPPERYLTQEARERKSDKIAWMLYHINPKYSKMIKAYLQGESIYSIAKLLNVTRQSVHNYFVKCKEEIKRQIEKADLPPKGFSEKFSMEMIGQGYQPRKNSVK